MSFAWAGPPPAGPRNVENPCMLLHAALLLALAQSRGPSARVAAAPRAAPSNSLTRVFSAFAASDVDRDGKISAQEAHAIPIGPAELAKNDLDGDGSWSREEFTLYYRGRLIADGQT